jgi:hypothetical protein
MRFVICIDFGPDEEPMVGEASRYIGRIASALASGSTSGKILEFGSGREIGSWGFVQAEAPSHISRLLGAARKTVQARYGQPEWEPLKDAIAELSCVATEIGGPFENDGSLEQQTRRR